MRGEGEYVRDFEGAIEIRLEVMRGGVRWKARS